jgi:acyl-CoA thioester hydrolase
VTVPPHRFPIRVYFEDTDAAGMVYHANYLRWAERARTESLRDAGLPHQWMTERHNALLVVRRIEVEYWRPARLDDALVVETSIRRVTPVQLVLEQCVLRDGGERLAELVVGLVCVDRDRLAPVPIPEPWRGLFRSAVPAAAAAHPAIAGAS